MMNTRRLMRAVMLGACLAVIAASAAYAQERRRIGPWDVITERNRFDDSGAIVIATQINRGMALGIRCLANRSFSLGLAQVGFGTGALRPGMSVETLVRIDNNPVERPRAVVVSDRLVQINLPLDKAQQLLNGREIAIRLEVEAASSDHVFRLSQGQRAIAPVLEACREPVAPVRAAAEGFFDFDRDAARSRVQEVLTSNRASLQVPTVTCGTTVSTNRTCEGKVSERLEFAIWEQPVENTDIEAYRKGQGPGRIETIHINLEIDEATQRDRANFAMICAAALRVATPNQSLQQAQRRVEAALADAQKRSNIDALTVGSSAGPGSMLEIEISRGSSIACIVMPKRNT